MVKRLLVVVVVIVGAVGAFLMLSIVELPARGVPASMERIEGAMIRSDIDSAIGRYRRRWGYVIHAVELPLQRAIGFDGVEIAVASADVDGALGANRR